MRVKSLVKLRWNFPIPTSTELFEITWGKPFCKKECASKGNKKVASLLKSINWRVKAEKFSSVFTCVRRHTGCFFVSVKMCVCVWVYWKVYFYSLETVYSEKAEFSNQFNCTRHWHWVEFIWSARLSVTVSIDERVRFSMPNRSFQEFALRRVHSFFIMGLAMIRFEGWSITSIHPFSLTKSI